MGNETVNDLLERLSSAGVDAAWSEFLARYSPIIKDLVRRHFEDADRAAECFSHVCGALSDDGFRRLRSFRSDGPAQFKTWLMAIVSNLCVDWRRSRQGRVRPLRPVARLPDLDQQVYRCSYLHAMSRAQCRRVRLCGRHRERRDARSSRRSRCPAARTPACAAVCAVHG